MCGYMICKRKQIVEMIPSEDSVKSWYWPEDSMRSISIKILELFKKYRFTKDNQKEEFGSHIFIILDL